MPANNRHDHYWQQRHYGRDIARAPQPDRARREAGATIDRILGGLRPGTGS
jgi:hypothetical protein